MMMMMMMMMQLGSVAFDNYWIFIAINPRFHQKHLLKACVCYFHQIFILPPNDSPSKTMKNTFHFI